MMNPLRICQILPLPSSHSTTMISAESEPEAELEADIELEPEVVEYVAAE